MHVFEKYIAFIALALAFTIGPMSAQTTPVYTDPAGSQTITQPSGSAVFLQETDTGQVSHNLEYKNLNCFGAGYSFGNNGTSAQGWSGCGVVSNTFLSTSSGIDHIRSDVFTHTAQGDTALQ